MAVVVENAMDQVEAYSKGNGVFPVPPEVAADNAKREGKADEKKVDTSKQDSESSTSTGGDKKTDAQAVSTSDKTDGSNSQDDVEGDDGLTPRQKRDYTKAMLATIGKKHRMQREAEEFAQAQYQEAKLAEARAAKLEADMAVLREQLKPAKVEEVKEPSRDAFKTDQEYWDAMVDFRVDKRLKVQQAEDARRAEENRQNEVRQHAAARIERAIELVPDFKEVTEAVDAIVPPFVTGYMQESDMFAELGYHFAKHPEVIERLTKITDGIREGTPAFVKAVSKQLVELGKIESTLKPFTAIVKDEENVPETSRETAKAEPETGSAPSKPRVIAPVIRPLNGGSASQVQKDEADMTGSQVIQTWQKKHGVKLTARKRH